MLSKKTLTKEKTLTTAAAIKSYKMKKKINSIQ